MDIVSISELTVPTRIGVFEWEKRIKQNLVLDLELGTDVARAAATDAIDDAIDYGAVALRVTELLENGQFLLIETVAERVAQLLLAEFATPWVRVRVAKPRILRNAREVAVTIERRAA
ncbi:MAG: dihydroneopterin aldolase [Gammaproteobacteria bacterium]|nr:dihydroneopterin aldolase [Gammaproteobacteria bacterium]